MPRGFAANDRGSKAVDRATYAMVLAAIQSCAASEGSGVDDHPDAEELRKIFLSLA